MVGSTVGINFRDDWPRLVMIAEVHGSFPVRNQSMGSNAARNPVVENSEARRGVTNLST
jgi:hypothetical protein